MHEKQTVTDCQTVEPPEGRPDLNYISEGFGFSVCRAGVQFVILKGSSQIQKRPRLSLNRPTKFCSEVLGLQQLLPSSLKGPIFVTSGSSCSVPCRDVSGIMCSDMNQSQRTVLGVGEGEDLRAAVGDPVWFHGLSSFHSVTPNKRRFKEKIPQTHEEF